MPPTEPAPLHELANISPVPYPVHAPVSLATLDALLSVALAGVFLLAAVPKLRHPESFTFTVLRYRVLPPPVARLYAALLPPAEFLVALLLLTGAAVRPAALGAVLLVASFVVGIGINLVRGRELACGCFGARGERRISWALVAQDVGLMALAGVAAGCASGWVTLQPWSPLHAARDGGSVTGVAACSVATLSVALFFRKWGNGEWVVVVGAAHAEPRGADSRTQEGEVTWPAGG